ncbi:MAG TPA: class II aldolase/adducin family protein [Burkholderiales bacterium]|nr:class II aldolase/adducin family protein [Burkholderiales bacterium]
MTPVAPRRVSRLEGESRIGPAEWQLRLQLAAAYRIADHLGWAELIYTHVSLRVPGPAHHFLINPYGLRFDEVSASNLVKIDLEGNTVGEHAYGANKAAFVIHGAIHEAREDAQCVFHTHTLAGMAIAAQEEGLLPVHMYSHNFYGKLAYHDFEGPSMRLDEQRRLVASLGSQPALILRNHGLLTLGRTVPEAFVRMWRLERACQVQLAAQGARLRLPSAEVCLQSQALGDEFLEDTAPLGELEFAALQRAIDAKDPGYRD